VREKKLIFALLGFGKLGQGFYKVWNNRKNQIKKQTGFDLILKHILVKNQHFKRPADVDPKIFTTDLQKILKDKSVKVAIDAIGDIEPTFTIIRQIMENGIHILSANRVLLATKMHELSTLANKHSVYFVTKPSLGGGIPVAAILKEDLVANKITEMYGIVSGISNYILSEMTDKKLTLDEVLRSPEIPRMAESISIIDYEGFDAAMKVAILAGTAFGIDINYLRIYAEGISDITPHDIRWADQFGYEIKLLAILKDHDKNFEVRVHPTLVPKNHPMVSVKGEYNAYYIKTDLLGEYMVYGLGIGTDPTCSLIIRDLIEIGNLIHINPKRQDFQFNWSNKPVLDINDIRTSYYIRFPCIDRPGVMGEVTTIIGNHNINITSAHAEIDKSIDNTVGFVHIFLEDSKEKEVRRALKEIKQLQLVKGDIKYTRILDNV
jgi:homoserine dehydrogenase